MCIYFVLSICYYNCNCNCDCGVFFCYFRGWKNRRLGTVGVPLDGQTVKIVDPETLVSYYGMNDSKHVNLLTDLELYVFARVCCVYVCVCSLGGSEISQRRGRNMCCGSECDERLSKQPGSQCRGLFLRKGRRAEIFPHRLVDCIYDVLMSIFICI